MRERAAKGCGKQTGIRPPTNGIICGVQLGGKAAGGGWPPLEAAASHAVWQVAFQPFLKLVPGREGTPSPSVKREESGKGSQRSGAQK